MTDQFERLRASLAGRYTIERELGRGGMATVYLARDVKHDRPVAVKVLRPELASALGGERFLREVRLTARLQHPHILTLIDSGEADGFLYYVMPYVEGKSLRQLLEREGQLPIDDALRITRAIASALDFAHAHGVIHRDIKPENVMLHQGEPMVADFGIALAVNAAGRERLTEAGLSLGTPAYMSPEQASADPKLDGRTDQYSLATVLYEMLAGEPPYTGPTAQAIIAKRMTEPIPHLSTVRQVPGAVERATSRALAKSPADRFPTLSEFVAALTRADPKPRPRRLRWVAAALGALIILAGAGALLYSRKGSSVAGDPNVVPFTSSPGQKFDPAFSPDGNEIAYSWRGENDDNADIYVKLIGPGSPLRLTTNPAEEYCPAWSPDGRYVAFVREEPASRVTYYIVPALGGAERRIGEASGQRQFAQRGPGQCLDWSADGKYLITADRIAPEDSGFSILRLSVEDAQRSVVVRQPALYVANPAVSPDGKLIAYVQGAGFLAGDIYVVPVSGGQPRRLTSEGRFLGGLDWTADGKAIVFSSNRGGLAQLWQISLSGGGPTLVNGIGEGASSPTVSPRGDRLAYVYGHADANLWRTPVPGGRARGAAPRKLIASSREDFDGAFSPDGRQIAFASDRSGNYEIWTSNSDGTNQTQLTFLGAAGAGTPRWSPDGTLIAFDARLSGHGDIFVVNADGGSPRRVTTDPADNNVPSWSRDGNWIYFSSNQTGTWQIWKVPVAGGSAVQVTKDGGFSAQESPDGRSLYVWTTPGTIWKVPPAGGANGKAVSVMQGVRSFAWWKVTADGIYFVDGSGITAPLSLRELTSGRTRRLGSLDLGSPGRHPMTFDVSPDGQWILFQRVDQVVSDIMLV